MSSEPSNPETPAGPLSPERPNHDRLGRLAPGNNLRGEAKKKKARGLARYLSQNTRDGFEMADIMLSLARTDGHRDQFRATEWVLNRIYGPAPTKMEVTGKDGAPLSPLAKVPIEELLALAKAKTP